MLTCEDVRECVCHIKVMCYRCGSQMFELSSSNTPKCMLPVANTPMIWFPVHFLISHKFEGISHCSVDAKIQFNYSPLSLHGLGTINTTLLGQEWSALYESNYFQRYLLW